MRRVYRAANLVEAHLLLHRLQQLGIAARVLNQHAQGGLGEIPFSHAYPEVWVDEDRDFDRARAEVAEFEAVAPPRESRRGGACGEENPSTFETCWRCAKPL